MPYPVYYRGEITIIPPLTEEHAAAVLGSSRREHNELTEPIFANIAASDEADLPWATELFDIAENRSTILPEEGESRHGLRLWLVLLVEHYLAPLGYVLNGNVSWDTDDIDDRGSIFIKDNVIEDVFDVVTNSGPSWAPSHYADEELKRVIRDLVDSSDQTGCTPDLTVVPAKYVQYLSEALPKL